MKKIVLYYFLFLSYHANSQVLAPGGVKGVKFWFVTSDNNRSPSFRNNITGDSFNIQASNTPSTVGYINDKPSLVFTGENNLQILLNTTDLHKSSYFTVYQPANMSQENILWHLTKEDKINLVHTTNRIADLEDSKYMNFVDVIPLNSKISTYVQNKQIDSPVSTKSLILGSLPEYPTLPITSFSGTIPEIIIYDSVLSTKDQIRVSSYLAIKYGVTLSEPGATYLNSVGDKIWDEEYYLYHNNIAGIGRDDSSGLYQKKSSSSNYPIILSVSTNDSIVNKGFLLWGENKHPFIVTERIAGIPPILEKKWIMVSSGISNSIATDLIVDTKFMDEPLPAKPVYWLAIDRTADNNFSLPSSEYLRMTEVDSKGMAHFNNVLWNAQGNNKSLFGFIVGGELLASANINNPTCTNPETGKISISVWGGKTPYTVQLNRFDQELYSQQTNERQLVVNGLPAGKYYIKVSDSLKHVYEDEFYINNGDAQRPDNILSTYILEEGKKIELDAGLKMPENISYEWKGPENFFTHNAKVSLIKPGKYTLITTNLSGCSYIQDIIIKNPPKGIFKKTIIYPNPSNGLFKIKVELDKPGNLNVEVYSEDGRMISGKQFSGFANYTFDQEIKASGLYFVVFSSGLSRSTKSVVVTK